MRGEMRIEHMRQEVKKERKDEMRKEIIEIRIRQEELRRDKISIDKKDKPQEMRQVLVQDETRTKMNKRRI